MNLFSSFSSLFSRSPRESRGSSADESREGGADETKMPESLTGFLNQGWDGEGGGTSLADPYNLSPWVQRAIKHIAGPIAQVELEFSENDVEVKDAALASFWNTPAKGLGRMGKLSRFDTIEATVGWLSLKGGFFWILDDTWLPVRAAYRSPFIIARPDRMKAILDDGELIGWIYTDANRRRITLIPDQVIHSHFWNPEDELCGAAPMMTARQAAEADYAAGKFWKALAEANGDLGDTVIAPNGISPEQEVQIKRALRAKRAAARRGKFQPMFFVGDVKTEQAKIQSPDASAVTQRLQNRHEVFIAFGVPPSFAEVTNSYSIGSASDRYRLIEETCMPIAAKIAEAAEIVTDRFMTGRKFSVSFCFDDHSTMQQVRAERMEAGRKMHERGVPWSVINDHLKLKLTPFPGWDTAWLPFNLQAVQDTVPPVVTPAVEDAPPAAEPMKIYDELEELLKGCAAHPRAHEAKADTGTADTGTVNPLWKRLMTTRAPYVKKMRVIVDRALFEARKETLANIAAAEAGQKVIRSGAFDFIFDIGRFLELMIEPLFKVSAISYEAAGVELMEEIGSADPFIPADPNGIAWLQARKNFIKDASMEVWENVRNSLEEGVSAGESYAKLSERVREDFNGISKEKSMRIAVTEIGIAFEGGRHDAMIQSGAQWKQWLTSEDDRVRLSHWALNGTTVPMDEPFLVGGVPMMFPCDPNGPAKEIINCRCVHGPVKSPENPDGINNDPTIPF